MSRLSSNSGRVNLVEPSGPVKAYNVIALPLPSRYINTHEQLNKFNPINLHSDTLQSVRTASVFRAVPVVGQCKCGVVIFAWHKLDLPQACYLLVWHRDVFTLSALYGTAHVHCIYFLLETVCEKHISRQLILQQKKINPYRLLHILNDYKGLTHSVLLSCVYVCKHVTN